MQCSLNLGPSRSPDSSDPMDVDDQYDEIAFPSSRESQNGQRFERHRQVPSKMGYQTSPLTKSQKRRSNRTKRLTRNLVICKDNLLGKNDEIRALTTKVEQLERRCLRYSADNPDLCTGDHQIPHTQVAAQSEETVETMKKQLKEQEILIKDLTLHGDEATEHNNVLQHRLEEEQLEKRQLLVQHKENISKSEEQALRDKEKPQNETRQLRIESEAMGLNYQTLHANFHKLKKESFSLHGQLQKTMSEREELQIENTKYLTEANMLSKDWKQLYEMHIVPWVRKKNMSDINFDTTSIKTAVANMAQDSLNSDILRDNAQSAKHQVQALQQQLLSVVEKVEVISDEQFSQQFLSLAASIKTFSRTAIQLSKAGEILDIGDIINATLCTGVRPAYWTTPIRRKCLIEAFIWSILVDYLFASPFSVLGDQYASLSATFFNMFAADDEQDLPLPSDISERWRRLTMQHLLGSVDQQLITNGKVNCIDLVLGNSIYEVRNRIFRKIEGPLHRLYPSIDSSKIYPILEKAFNLAMHMSLQQFRLQVVAPNVGDNYTAGITPEMTSTMESESVPVGTVGFIVRPGLAKWGDAHGKNLDQRLDLVPSLVFAEPCVEKEA